MLKSRANGAVSSLRFWFVRLLVVVSATAAVGATIAPCASAVTGYHIANATNPVHAYSAPNAASGIVQALAPGAALNIVCQEYGQTVRGSNIWDALSAGTGGGWVSDYYTSTPNYNAFSPGIPRCSQSAYPTPTQTNVLGFVAMQAFSRAAAQIGHSTAADGKPWGGYCDHFVAYLYHRASSGYATANAHYNDLMRRGLIHLADTNPPLGALVFFDLSAPLGHVAFSWGNGNLISTPQYPGQVVYTTTISHFGHLLGWAWPNPEWLS